MEVLKISEHVVACLEYRVPDLSSRRRNQAARGQQHSQLPRPGIPSFETDGKFLRLKLFSLPVQRWRD